MAIENTTLYSSFKPVKINNNTPNKQNKDKITLRPLLGATLGVGSALIISSKLFKNKPHTTFNEVSKMLLMAGSGNIGAVLLNSINKTKNQKKAKWKEAGFQMMNTTIPMLMVSSTLEICKKIKTLNNKPAKIIGSFIAMATGAMIATKITNIGKEKQEKRKYTIKDSIANFDDIIATIAIGFRDILKYVPVDKILPFIYIYCGSRAGSKADNETKENYKDK